MDKSAFRATRRSTLAAGTVALLWFGLGPRAARGAKATKQDFMYQSKPKGDASCANCKLFSKSPSGGGTCALVEGEIMPNGWCMAYTPMG